MQLLTKQAGKQLKQVCITFVFKGEMMNKQ